MRCLALNNHPQSVVCCWHWLKASSCALIHPCRGLPRQLSSILIEINEGFVIDAGRQEIGLVSMAMAMAGWMSAEVPPALAASLKCMDQTVRILNIDCLAVPRLATHTAHCGCNFYLSWFYLYLLLRCLPLRQKVRFIYRWNAVRNTRNENLLTCVWVSPYLCVSVYFCMCAVSYK